MARSHEITLNQVPIRWDLDAGNLSFFGLPSVLLWSNPSLYRMLKPLVDHVGVDLFSLMVAHESSKGTAEDYHAMVTQLGNTFAEGFLAWGEAVSTAGWGRFELPEIDMEAHLARVRIHNPWELQMLRDTGDSWGCPFIQGKLIGIFSHAFGVTCWADQETLDVQTSSIEFRIYPAERTLKADLELLQRQLRETRERGLRDRIDRATDEIKKEKQSLIRRLSTPLIQVWDGILVIPLIGDLDASRAQILTENTLRAISEKGTSVVIIDVTGVSQFDSESASHLLQTIAAAALLGARCLLAGISPRIAQMLVASQATLKAVPCFATTQAALEHAIGKQSGDS